MSDPQESDFPEHLREAYERCVLAQHGRIGLLIKRLELVVEVLLSLGSCNSSDVVREAIAVLSKIESGSPDGSVAGHAVATKRDRYDTTARPAESQREPITTDVVTEAFADRPFDRPMPEARGCRHCEAEFTYWPVQWHVPGSVPMRTWLFCSQGCLDAWLSNTSSS